jgi:CheY-like chemotaxis protein
MRKDSAMKIRVMLLLTNDLEVEDSVAEALVKLGGVSHLTRNAGEALKTVCGVHDLDLAVIDFENGPHGMTLLSAITMLREHLPIIVITRDDDKHVEALAYANGAAACLAKPITATEVGLVIQDLPAPKLELAAT